LRLTISEGPGLKQKDGKEKEGKEGKDGKDGKEVVAGSPSATKRTDRYRGDLVERTSSTLSSTFSISGMDSKDDFKENKS
jgi:hypothetical protein